MNMHVWTIYLLAAIGLSLTPGPNGLLSLTHGACFGFRSTVFTILGGALGFFVLIAASLAGLGALLAASEQAFTVMKWIGAAYLVYLGIRVWRAPAPTLAAASLEREMPEAGPIQLFSQGFLVAVTNPKGLIFFAAFLPQFMVPGMSYPEQLVLFGGTFILVEILYELMLARTAQQIAPWLARHGRWFNRATGGVFVGVGAVLTTMSR
ncbi:LysE family translocator [Pseudaminobacter salicylatoxidans]|uniref:LysE family translocator n=1 Tax=Pseudaminobacter salicylatoxidans TaxID=93369 RepID=UPI0002F202F7|nr:LysE family translocator [Pseudaminobacter salicylatoxidans]